MYGCANKSVLGKEQLLIGVSNGMPLKDSNAISLGSQAL